MYRNYRFKIIHSVKNRRLVIRLSALGLWLICFFVANNSELFMWINEIKDFWLFSFLIIIIFHWFIPSYNKIGYLELRKNDVSLKYLQNDLLLEFNEIEEFTVVYRGHFGQYSTASFLSGLTLFDFKNGALNFLLIKYQNGKLEEQEFLSKNSYDLKNLEKYCELLNQNHVKASIENMMIL